MHLAWCCKNATCFCVAFVLLELMRTCSKQVASWGPAQDVIPLTMMRDGVYVDGELCDYWRLSFPWPSVSDVWNFVLNDIDDERCEFIRSLAWRGPHSPL